MIIALKTLAKHIGEDLTRRGFCVVFENDLKRCWPSDGLEQAQREREIQRFAQSQGWSAAILEGEFGVRAIFRRKMPLAAGPNSR